MAITSLDRSNTYGRQIGLGAGPSENAADYVLQCGFTQVPVIEYVTWTTNVPLLDSELQATFGTEVDILQNPKSVIGIDQVDSSFIVNSILQADMLAIGFGIHVFGEPQSFVQIGNVLSPAPATVTNTPVSPDAFTVNDVAGGGLCIPQGSTLLPGILKWGYNDWKAAWHFCNAYQFQWVMQQRHLLINELAADVAYYGPYAEASAAGTSEASIQEYARLINDRYRAKAGVAGGMFVPINARRIGSVNGPIPNLNAGNNGLYHPTRDFDLAPMTWGGIRNQGGAACCMPFRKLIRPVLLEKGIPIGMRLIVQDDFHHTQFLRNMSISENQGGNIATVNFDANASGLTFAPAGAGGGCMPELTLDQGVNQFSGQQVTTSRTIMKGGTIKFAILIKGFEVWGPWKEYIIKNMSQYVSVPGSTPGVGGLPAFTR